MVLLPLLLVLAPGGTPPNPYQLPIGTPGTMQVRTGEIVRGTNGRKVAMRDVVRAAENVRYILLGESHDHPEHHQMQADVISALAKSGRDVVVGFEMFTRPNQPNLYGWSLGWGSEDDFIQESNWKKEWGFDFGIYRPVFQAVRQHRLPMVALNVPRDWVRTVGRGGYGALTDAQRAELPTGMSLENREHRSVFESLMGGHPLEGTRGENMYAAQVLWDEGMADSALKWMARRAPNPKSIMVILAGSGHVMYGQGINARLLRQQGEKSVSVVMIEGDEPSTVRRGLGYFVYQAKALKRKENG